MKTDSNHIKRETITELTTLSENHISVCTSNLVRFGYLEKVGKGGRSRPAFYRIIMDSNPPGIGTGLDIPNPPEIGTGLNNKPSRNRYGNEPKTRTANGVKPVPPPVRGKDRDLQRLKTTEKNKDARERASGVQQSTTSNANRLPDHIVDSLKN